MSSGSKDFEDFARDCVRLAGQADCAELREKLLNQAREWMQAAMEEDAVSCIRGQSSIVALGSSPGSVQQKQRSGGEGCLRGGGSQLVRSCRTARMDRRSPPEGDLVAVGELSASSLRRIGRRHRRWPGSLMRRGRCA